MRLNGEVGSQISQRNFKPRARKADRRLLSIGQFNNLLNEGCKVLDFRSSKNFKEEFIPNSIFIPSDPSMGIWMHIALPNYYTQAILITDPGEDKEIVERLHVLGYSNILGTLDGGINAWIHSGGEVERLLHLTKPEVISLLEDNDLDVLELVKTGVTHASYPSATPLSVSLLADKPSSMDPESNYLICSQQDSWKFVAVSLFKHYGFKHVFIPNGTIKSVS